MGGGARRRRPSASTEVAAAAPPADAAVSSWITRALRRLAGAVWTLHDDAASEVAVIAPLTSTVAAPLAHGDVDVVANGEVDGEVGDVANGEVRKNQAWMFRRFGPNKKGNNASTPSSTDQPPQREQMVVDGEPVPFEVEDQYVSYCRSSAANPNRSVCHICFFDENFIVKKTFPDREMLLHCYSHKCTVFIPCPDCRVYVSTARDLKLHMHYCHNMPPGWWRSR